MNDENKKTILLVEDEAIIAIAQKAVLEKYGYSIIIANSGEKAIELFNKTNSIDLILMDIDLGSGIDGTETAGIILKERDIPVVFLSSHAEPAVVEKTEKITSYGYVVKSSSITVLDASIKMAFKLFAANTNIKKQMTQLTDIVEFLPDACLAIDNEKRVIIWNKAIEKISGIQASEMIGKGDYAYTIPFYGVARKQLMDLIFDNDNDISSRYSGITREGDAIIAEAFCNTLYNNKGAWIYAKVSPLHDHAGNIIGAIELIRDITEQKQAEEKILKKEKYFRLLIEKAPDGIVLINTLGEMSYASPAAKRIFGYAETDDLLPNPAESTFPEDLPMVLSSLEKIIKNPSHVETIQYRFKNKDGTLRWIESTFSNQYSDPGIESIIINFRDITDRIQKEEALRESEERFREIIESSWDIHYRQHAITYKLDYMSPAITRVLGYTIEEVLTMNMEDQYKLFHPDDLPQMMGFINDLTAASEKDDRRIERVFRMFHKSGEVRWMNGSYFLTRDMTGDPKFVVGVLKDITKRKQTEEALIESEERFRKLSSFTFEGIIIHNNLTAIDVNESMVKLLGYERNEIIGMNLFNVIHPDYYAIVKNNVIKQIATSYQIVAVRKDGSSFYAEIEGKNVSYNGELFRVACIRDITERKKAEELISTAKDLLTSILESSPEVIVFALDAQYRYIAFNLKHKTVIKQIWGKEIAVGMNMLDIIGSHEDGKKAKANFDRALSGESFVVVEDYGDEELSRQSWLVYWSPIRSKDGPAIGLTCFVINNTEQKKAETKIKAFLSEKELILKEVHHRIKNNMNTINGLLTLQTMSLNDPLAISALQDTISRVDSMGMLYDKLYRSDNFREMSLLVYLPSLVDEIVSNFPDSKSVKIEKQIDDFVIELEKLQPLGIIINELLTNTMKYAFTGRDNNLITVSATLTGKKVSVIISDNGNGIPESITFENSTGFGMQLISMLTEQIGGTIRIERGNGTRFVLEFDL